MKTFIVVDANNHWLDYGQFKDAKEALDNTKECSSLYDPNVEVNVYEIKSKPCLVEGLK